MFQSSSESVIKKATLLSDMHIKGLRQKMTLIQLREESAKKLEVKINSHKTLQHHAMTFMRQ